MLLAMMQGAELRGSGAAGTLVGTSGERLVTLLKPEGGGQDFDGQMGGSMEEGRDPCITCCCYSNDQ